MENNQRGVKKRSKTTSKNTAKRTNHLLIIGIDEYSNGVPTLNNAVRDAENFRDLLLNQYQFDAKNVTTLFNAQATLTNIRRTFSKLLKKLTDKDNLIFYYSGHGEQLPYGREKRGYWIPYDAELGEDYTYIPNEEISLLFKNSSAHHVFGIVDSCFSGSLFQQRSLTTAEDRINSYPSRWLLTAGRLEPVSDGSLGTNSPFATALLTYLKNHPDNSFWASDLCNQVLKGMQFNTTKQTPRGEPLQEVGHYGGQFVFYKKGFTPEPENVPPLTNNASNDPQRSTSSTSSAEPIEEIAAPSTLVELQNHLKSLAQTNLKKAMEVFQGYLKPSSSKTNDLILQLGRYNGTNNQLLGGLITSDQANRTNNQIRYALLSYIDDLEKDDVQL